jgi:hypothetical protein
MLALNRGSWYLSLYMCRIFFTVQTTKKACWLLVYLMLLYICWFRDRTFCIVCSAEKVITVAAVYCRSHNSYSGLAQCICRRHAISGKKTSLKTWYFPDQVRSCLEFLHKSGWKSTRYSGLFQSITGCRIPFKLSSPCVRTTHLKIFCGKLRGHPSCQSWKTKHIVIRTVACPSSHL